MEDGVPRDLAVAGATDVGTAMFLVSGGVGATALVVDRPKEVVGLLDPEAALVAYVEAEVVGERTATVEVAEWAAVVRVRGAAVVAVAPASGAVGGVVPVAPDPVRACLAWPETSYR